MHRLIEPPTTPPTPKQRDRMDAVHDLAAEFATLPADRHQHYLDTVVRRQTSGYDRFKTIEHTPPDSPNFAPLMAMLDALVASEASPAGRTYATKHGLFTDADLRESGAMTTKDEIVFPVRYPWAVRPVVQDGVIVKPGTRGDPVYRTAAERSTGPERDDFRAVPKLRPSDDDDPWGTS
jgi:hypothetical protein